MPRPTQNEAAYARLTPGSRRAFADAAGVLSGGVAADVKFMTPHPLYVAHGHGARLTDVDGNAFIDLRLGSGSLILGHAPAPVVAAVRAQLDRGLVLTLPTELDAELARRIERHMPHVEHLRFVNSGSEATIMAVRAARAYTGRDRVAKLDGGFHGHAHDNLLLNDAGRMASGDLAQASGEAAPTSAGVPRHAAGSVVILPLNDAGRAADLLEAHGDELAAVIVDPLPLSVAGGQPPDGAYLRAVRKAAHARGIVLIFDEMITGFRLSLGGATARHGVTPDLVALGKIIGGGMPIGAFGGREEIMASVVAPGGRAATVKQSGTHSGHPLAMAAGIATLDELERQDPYATLRARGSRLRAGLAAACAESGLDAEVAGTDSVFHVRFGAARGRGARDPVGSPQALHRDFCLGLMAAGVYLAPGQAGFLSAAHTDEDVEEVLAAARSVLRGMAARLET